ncbi:hypothetical protein ABMB44_15075, partial [Levilactobacillus brevis]
EQETREEQIRAEERQKILEKTAKWRLTMTELERIAELEKRLKERKRKALAKEYEKLGSNPCFFWGFESDVFVTFLLS